MIPRRGWALRPRATHGRWRASVLNAIALDPIGGDTYRFDYLAQPKAGVAEGTRIAGGILEPYGDRTYSRAWIAPRILELIDA